MKILLVYPGLIDGFNSYDRHNNWCNHGVSIISSLLKKEGHTVAYIDCRKLSGWTEFSQKISGLELDIVLISVATVDFDASRKIARIVKTNRQSTRIMVGGPHPTLMTDETASVEDFDYIFTHEAEITLPLILRNIEMAPRIIKGEMPPDLDAIPFVDRGLAPEGETPWFRGFRRPYFAVTASRGCMYSCTFCQPAERAMFGNKVRKRSVDNLLLELTSLSEVYGMQSFMIHDDCFTQYYTWVEEFCDRKKQLGLTQVFACQSRADIICKRPDLFKKLKDAGLRCVLIGFESGSDRVLNYIKKNVTVEQNIRAARICSDLGIQIFANYMFGLPTETPEEMRETVRMIRTMKPDYYSPAVFTPAPGSSLYEFCKQNDLILISSPEGYRRNALSGAKIKGVDYPFVDKMVAQSKYGYFLGPLWHAATVLLQQIRRRRSKNQG